MNKYGALWQGHELEIEAETTYKAQQLAIVEFQRVAGRRKVKGYDITVMLLQLNGVNYVHTAVN